MQTWIEHEIRRRTGDARLGGLGRTVAGDHFADFSHLGMRVAGFLPGEANHNVRRFLLPVDLAGVGDRGGVGKIGYVTDGIVPLPQRLLPGGRKRTIRREAELHEFLRVAEARPGIRSPAYMPSEVCGKLATCCHRPWRSAADDQFGSCRSCIASSHFPAPQKGPFRRQIYSRSRSARRGEARTRPAGWYSPLLVSRWSRKESSLKFSLRPWHQKSRRRGAFSPGFQSSGITIP